MTSPLRKLCIGGAVFGGTCIVAVLGYLVAGWDLLDSTYMVTITIFGVGFGEVRPITEPWLKIFTMFVIIGGCSSGIYAIGGFVQLIAEGEINRAFGARRMSQGIERLQGHALICGFGRVGRMLARDLSAAAFPFVVIDSCEQRLTEAQALGYLTVLGNASDEQILETAGIKRARVLATVLPDDAANVFITLSARELNGTLEIIARAEDPATEKKLIRSGANRVVMPAFIGATKISHMITRPSAEELLQEQSGAVPLNEELFKIGLELAQIEVAQQSPLVGRLIREIESGSGGFVIIAVRQADGTLLRDPRDDLQLAAGDVVILVGHSAALPQLRQKAKTKSTLSYRGASV